MIERSRPHRQFHSERGDQFSGEWREVPARDAPSGAARRVAIGGTQFEPDRQPGMATAVTHGAEIALEPRGRFYIIGAVKVIAMYRPVCRGAVSHF
jgi:hypothetical protein